MQASQCMGAAKTPATKQVNWCRAQHLAPRQAAQSSSRRASHLCRSHHLGTRGRYFQALPPQWPWRVVDKGITKNRATLRMPFAPSATGTAAPTGRRGSAPPHTDMRAVLLMPCAAHNRYDSNREGPHPSTASMPPSGCGASGPPADPPTARQ